VNRLPASAGAVTPLLAADREWLIPRRVLEAVAGSCADHEFAKNSCQPSILPVRPVSDEPHPAHPSLDTRLILARPASAAVARSRQQLYKAATRFFEDPAWREVTDW